MTGMAILSETHTLVIDGGTRGDAAQIVELLLANGRTSVDAWFLTHPHHDHVGAITEVLDNIPTLSVDKIYCRFPSLSALLEMGFISNVGDATLLAEHPELFAQGIYSGILDYFGFLPKNIVTN